MTRPSPRTILVVGWLVFLLYSYPGYMTTESADTLLDSRVGLYTDWHWPVLTQIWAIVEIVIAGPAGMLLLQSGLTLWAVFSLARRVGSERAAAIAAVCTLLCPPVLTNLSLITAEPMLGSLLLAASALLVAGTRKRVLLALALLAIACGLRDGATVAALPAVAVLLRWDGAARWRRVAIAAAAWALVALLGAGLERVTVDVRTDRNEVALAMSDIVGTLRYAPAVSDARVRELMPGVQLAAAPQIQKRAREIYGKDLFYAATDARVFEPAETEAARDALYAARSALRSAVPGAYAKHRWQQLSRALGLHGSWTAIYARFVQIYPREALTLQQYALHSDFQLALIRPVELLSRTPLFYPYLYLALALVLLPFAIARRQTAAAALLASGIGYELSLAVSTVHAEYRHSHWLVLATVTAIALVVLRARDGNRRSSGESVYTSDGHGREPSA